MSYRACIFDLDGTLCDSVESITWSANHMLADFGMRQASTKDLEIFAREARRATWALVLAPVGQVRTERMLRPPTWRAVTPFADPEKPPKAMEGSAIIKV